MAVNVFYLLTILTKTLQSNLTTVAMVAIATKEKRMKSVLQNWVMELPLREQGTILTAIRGGDLTPKMPYDSPERQLVGWIRCMCLNAADPREIGIKGAFFQTTFPDFKWSEFGHYPLHWVSHVAHTLEVIAVRHPDAEPKMFARHSYKEFCNSMHVNPETPEQMIARLSEDRIVNNNVVS